jgi:septation ring formation regulator EzrA
VERAGYRVEESVFAIADAERQLAEIRLDPESSPQAIREAEIALAEAKLSAKDATDEQKDATDDLATSQSTLNELIYGAVVGSDFYAQFSDALTEAKGRQEEATIRVADAIDREAEAQERLNTANEKAAEIARLYPKIAASVPNPMASVVTQPNSTIGNRYYEMGSASNAPQITINAGLGASGVQIGQELDEYLRDYLRLSGNTFAFGSI